MAYDVCGLGTLAADVLMTVDHLPGKDSFCMVQHTENQPGGSGTNTIVQAARLGSRCAYIGAIGNDAPGDTVKSSLEAEGVDVSHLYVRPGEVTTHTEIVVDRDGQKFILLIMGDAFFKLRLNKADRQVIHEAKVFFTDLLPGWAAMSGLKEAFYSDVKVAMALEVGVPLFEEMGVTKSQILESLRYAHLLVPCRDAVKDLTGTIEPLEAGRKLREYCDEGTIVLTMGGDGSFAFTPDGGILRIPAISVKTVDTTGAGDSFMGALIHSYLVKGYPIEQSLQFASVCAARTCTGLGARYKQQKGYPTMEEALRLYSEGDI